MTFEEGHDGTSLGGATVLLTTHDMADVEQLCSRVLIIDHGTLLYDGTLDGIRDRLSTERTLVVDLASDGPGRVDVPGATEVRADGPRRWLQFNRLVPANLALGIACHQPRIGVDIHVHRITNRWGYVTTANSDPTLAALEQKLPEPYWLEINALLVPFGKNICTPVPNARSARCRRCANSETWSVQDELGEFCEQRHVERGG